MNLNFKVTVKKLRYANYSNDLCIDLNNDVSFYFPPNLISELKNLNPEQLSELHMSANKDRLLHDECKIDLSISNLITKLFSTESYSKTSEYYAEIGRKGGSSKSEKKAIAARINGKKGGRPKKQ